MLRKPVSEGGKKVRALLLVTALAAGLAACGDSTGPETSQVQILLTDAPTDMLDSAHVWISHVYLQGGGDEAAEDASGRVDLFNDPENPHRYDLLRLQDGLTADLTGVVEVHAGLYQGLRLVVDSARLTLAEGYAFEDGTRVGVFKVPSGDASGIKVKLADVLSADEGEVVTVTVDFDVDRNFVIQAAPQTGVVTQVLFTPVLQEKSREEAPAS